MTLQNPFKKRLLTIVLLMRSLIELVSSAGLATTTTRLFLFHRGVNILIVGAFTSSFGNGRENWSPIRVVHLDCGDLSTNNRCHLFNSGLVRCEIGAVECLERWKPNLYLCAIFFVLFLVGEHWIHRVLNCVEVSQLRKLTTKNEKGGMLTFSETQQSTLFTSLS